MFNECCIVNCASKRRDVHFHRFPKSNILLLKWLECINCERLRSLSLEDLRKQFLCRKHFEKRFLASTPDRARLRSDAYPTLFTATEITSGIPETSVIFSDYVKGLHDLELNRQHEDHTYCKAEAAEKSFKTGSELFVQSSASHDLEIPNVSDLYLSEPTEIPKENDNAAFVINISIPSKSCRRVTYTKNKLTPHCARLRKIHRNSQRQSSYYQRARKALIFSKTKMFEKLTNKMNPLAKKFIWMQIKHCTKNATERQFSDEEKLLALSLLKQSPKCYRFLHKIFILPSKDTLDKMIANDSEVGKYFFN